MEYIVLQSQKAIARFGKINTSRGEFEMPAISPGIRTSTDAEALMKNIRGGLIPPVITPYVSWRKSYLGTIGKILGRSYIPIDIDVKTLVIPDIESEALSFNCTARNNYKKSTKLPKGIENLMETGLSPNAKKEIPSCHTGWDNVEKDYGITPIKDFAVETQRAIGTDVFLAPTPIIRAKISTVKKAFHFGYSILDNVISDSEFIMNGLHLLVHSEIFRDDEKSINARKSIYNELDTWSTLKSDKYTGIFLSLKIHDATKELLEPKEGTIRRRALSEFITELSERVRKAKGVLVTHNFGAWSLGTIDSGADISSFRVSGRMQIDKPIINKNTTKIKKKERVYNITDHRTFSQMNQKDSSNYYKIYGTLPISKNLKVKTYWAFEKSSDKKIFVDSTWCGALIQIGQMYRDSGLKLEIPLREALRSQVKEHENEKELLDLCPTLW